MKKYIFRCCGVLWSIRNIPNIFMNITLFHTRHIKLTSMNCSNWGGTLAEALAAETDLVLNLASREYSRAVEPHLPSSVRFLTCVFGEEKGGKVVEKGTMCKMARGEMVRFLAEHNISRAQDVRDFDRLGYRFSPACSTENHFVFIK